MEVLYYLKDLKIEKEEDKLMKLNKTWVFFIAIATVFCFAGTALAANRVEVKVTSEPIGYHAPCDKAGGWSLEWDTATVLEDGDIITIDMPTNPATGEEVTICNSFDIEISPSGAGTFWTGALAAGGNIPATDCPFVDEQQTSRLVGESEGIMFRIIGTAGESRVTLHVIGASSGDALQVGTGEVEDNLILYFLDQTLNADYATNGVWQYGTTTPAVLADNTLCINVEQWEQPVGLANMDSMHDKYTFIPSNPQIFHIINAAYEVFDCKGKADGHIPLGSTSSTQAGGTENCPGFDNESGRVYCTSPAHVKNYFIVEKTIGTWDIAEYTIEMEVLVDGVSGDNGFYFTDDAVYTASAASITAPALSGLCAYSNKIGYVVGNQDDYTYNGTTDPVAANTGECEVATDNRSTTLNTYVASGLGLSSLDKFLLVDIPEMHYDLDAVTAGDVVSVTITIKKAPCGVVFEDTITVATYGCPTIPPAEQTSCLTFPYFTPVNDADWWAGLVITNLADNDGTATIKIYEQDGDQGEATVTVGALSQYVGLLTSLSFTQTAGTGTIGDSRSFIVVCFTGSNNIDGFAMMGDQTQAQGYLPRHCNCDSLCGFSK